MNPTEIEWCDKSNNAVTGCNKLCCDANGRIYCFAYYMAQRQKGRNGYPVDQPFRPTLHSNMLIRSELVKRPQKVFSTSMGDLFDAGVPDVWRHLVMNQMQYSPQHQFIVLTKQLRRMAAYFINEKHRIVPDNLWLGISQDGITTDQNDIELFGQISKSIIPRKVVSFEPLLGRIDADIEGIDWVIIGAQTGTIKKQPEKSWIVEIVRKAKKHNIPIFLKDNLDWANPAFKKKHWQKWPAKMVQDLKEYDYTRKTRKNQRQKLSILPITS